MATELLYNFDSYVRSFSAKVISCTETFYEKNTLYDIVLDRTCFFPEQGGQDCDEGTLTFDGNQVDVIHVSIQQNIVHHICSAPITEGSTVQGDIEWDGRFDRMQQHSGEHLFSGTVHRLFGFDNVGFHLSSHECTLDFNGTFSDEELNRVEDIVNGAVYENFEVKVSIPSPEELAKLQYRSKKELLGDVRIVEYPGYDICACCAPHVARTGEIGIIKIVAAEHFKGGTRIWIKCGKRAVSEFRDRLCDCRQISQITSSKIQDIAKAVSKLNDSLKSAKFDNISLQRKVLSNIVNEASKLPNPYFFIESGDSDSVREAVNTMMHRSKGYCGAFIGNDDDGYRFVIGSSTGNCRDLMEDIRLTFDLRGGGTTDMIQGTIKCKQVILESFWQRHV